MRFFTLLGRDTKHSRFCVYFGNCFLCFFEMFFPQTWVVSSHTSAIKYSVEGLRGTLYRSLKLSLWEALSSGVLCPVSSSCFGLPRLLPLPPQSKKTAGTLLPVLQPGNSPQAEAGNRRAHLISFSSLRDCYFVLPEVVSENCCFLYFI